VIFHANVRVYFNVKIDSLGLLVNDDLMRMEDVVGGLDFGGLGVSHPLSGPLVMAHYVPWFTQNGRAWPLPTGDLETIPAPPEIPDWRHWRDPASGYGRSHLLMPEIGCYDSRDPAVIGWQIAAAKSAGIDGFVINWYGCNSVENVITLHFLNALKKWNDENPQRPFLYQLCFDTQSQLPTEGKVPVSLEQDFSYVRNHLIRSGCLMRHGRPVFLCFSYGAAVSAWTAAAIRVFGDDGCDLLWPHPGDSLVATGRYLWVAPDGEGVARENSDYPWPDPGDAGATRAAQAYAAWARSGDLYGMAGVWPGFNDSLVTWAWHCPTGQGRRRPRIMAAETADGCTYDILWDAYHRALTTPAGVKLPLVQIVTWNDHAESTAIEPTREFGTRYLEKTRRQIMESKRLWRELAAGTGTVATPSDLVAV